MNKLAMSICGTLALGATINVYASPELGAPFQAYFGGSTENLQSVLEVHQSDNFSSSLQQSGQKQQSVMISEGTALRGNDRTFTVQQRGKKNDSMIEVTGRGNHTNVTIDQSGKKQGQLTLIEYGANRNTVTVDQINAPGNDDNWSEVEIHRGDRNNIAISQSGLKSESYVYMVGNSSDRNTLNVTQVGDYHESEIIVAVGEQNLVNVDQSGTWHESFVVIDGSSNHNDVNVDQSDNGNESVIILDNNSGYNDINILQTGDLSFSLVELHNSSGTMGSNTIDVTQNGGNYSSMTLTDSNNITVSVVQN
jgi:hypothetical protein